ncbi:hypothetical protein ACJX0J_017641 [Zea mays]
MVIVSVLSHWAFSTGMPKMAHVLGIWAFHHILGYKQWDNSSIQILITSDYTFEAICDDFFLNHNNFFTYSVALVLYVIFLTLGEDSPTHYRSSISLASRIGDRFAVVGVNLSDMMQFLQTARKEGHKGHFSDHGSFVLLFGGGGGGGALSLSLGNEIAPSHSHVLPYLLFSKKIKDDTFSSFLTFWGRHEAICAVKSKTNLNELENMKSSRSDGTYHL